MRVAIYAAGFHFERDVWHRQVCYDERGAAAEHLSGVGLVEGLEGWGWEEEFPVADLKHR
jgi:hypothetical protein